MKRFLRFAVCAAVLLALLGGCGETPKDTVQAELGFADGGSYEIGDVMALPIPALSEDETVRSYTVEVTVDGQLLTTLTENDTAYRFVTGGEHTFTYRIVTAAAILTDSFTCTAQDGSGVIIDWLPEQVGRFDTVTLQPVTVQLGGSEVTAQLTVTDPTGRQVLPEDGAIAFDKEGTYTFTFDFEGPDGQSLTQERSVQASLNASDLFTFVSGGVSKENGAAIPEGMGAFNGDYEQPDNEELSASGVKLTFNGVSTVRFNNVIDLNSLSADTSLFELFVLPASVPEYTGHVQGAELSAGDTLYPSGGYTHGTANFTQFELKLTDIYDPYNVVTVRYFAQKVLSYWNWNESYVSVGNATLMQALDNEGVVQQASAAYNDVGYITSLSFYGEGSEAFNLYLDYETKCFYITNGERKILVLDYDDAEALGAANVWNGFTTGECYMELSFPSVTADSSVLVTSVLGAALGAQTPTDTVPPQLSLALTQLPQAQSGKFYPLPEATAFDAITGSCKVSVEVTDAAGTVLALADGGFVPAAAGEYTVRYTASDFYGNTAERSYVLTAAEQLDPITAELPEGLHLYAGIAVREPQLQISGGSGDKSYTVTYLLDGEQVEPQGGYLTFHRAGTVQLLVAVTDYLGSYEQTLTCTVEAPAAPVLAAVTLPQAIFAGRAYTFPVAEAYDYNTQSYVPVRVTVNGTVLDGTRSYTPTEEDLLRGSVIAVYTAAGSGEVTSASYTVQVLEHSATAGAVIEGNGVTTQFGDRYATVTAGSAFRIRFAYAVAARKFTLSLGGVASEENFTTLTLTLRDAGDANRVVTAKLTKQPDGKFAVTLCGRTEQVTIPWADMSNDNQATLVLALDGDALVLKSGSEVLYGSYAITAWDSGIAYDGFVSGGLYASTAVGGVSGQTSVRLYGFSGQSYNRFNIFSDAQVALAEAFESSVVELGARVRIPTASGYSPASSQVSVRYEVVGPDGSVIASGAGANGGSFTCQQYGQYKVVWYLTDEVNNKQSVEEMTFTVYDRTAPELTVNTAALKAKAGKALKLPGAEVSDNLGAEQCVLRVSVINTHGCSTDVTDTMTYTPAEAGSYRIVYMAMDEAGNICVKTVSVTVEGG